MTRRFLAILLVVAATVVAVGAVGARWVQSQVADRTAYVDAVAPLAEDPAVRDLLAAAAAQGAVDSLARYSPLGLPDAVDGWALAGARRVIESPAFTSFWREANADVHAQVLALLEDSRASTQGQVTVDAGPLVAQVLLLLGERGLPVGLLPDVDLQVPVVAEAKVAEAGPAYRVAAKAATVLPVIWLALVALAIAAAIGVRGRIRVLGLALLGVALAGVALHLAAEPIGDLVIERARVDRQAMAGVMVEAVAASLAPYVRVVWWAAPAGLVLLVGSCWPRRRTAADSALHWSPQGPENR